MRRLQGSILCQGEERAGQHTEFCVKVRRGQGSILFQGDERAGQHTLSRLSRLRFDTSCECVFVFLNIVF